MSKKERQKLRLTDEEQSLIKGLMKYTTFNDQRITAIFSHVSRSINHRAIGYFRDQNNPKYSIIKPASKEEVDAFLVKYWRFEFVAKQLGLLPKEEYFTLVEKATEAMKCAVSTFNNPTFKWKSEIFIVNSIIAWTYLLHAYYKDNDIDYRYKKDGEIQFRANGRPNYWDLSKCIKFQHCPLPEAVKCNLRYLIEIRNQIEHSLCEEIDDEMAPMMQACALNFNNFTCEWFGDAYSIAEDLSFAIQFAQISLENNREIVGERKLPSVIKAVNSLVEKGMTKQVLNDQRYSYHVYIYPKTVNNSKNADQTATYAPAGSEVHVAIKETERKKYRPNEIVKQMKAEGFANFSMHKNDGFVNLWKEIDGKNAKYGLGVKIAGDWYWYEEMMDKTREILAQRLNDE